MYKFLVPFLILGVSCAPPPAGKVKTAEEGTPIDTVGITEEITEEFTEVSSAIETVYVTTVETVVETVEVMEEIPMVAPAAVKPGVFGVFKVQVGAFKNEENANSLYNSLKDEYGELICIENILPYWKVRIGNYSTRSKATPMLDELREKGFGDAWIARTYQ